MPRQIRVACAVAGVLAALLFAWVVTGETFDLFGETVATGGFPKGFYDAQANALLHGRFDVPRSVIGFEAILTDGRSYGYFGPAPAFLRMPVLLIAPSAEGHLNALFMLAAFAVAFFFAARLAWDVRRLVRGSIPPSRFEPILVAGIVGLLTSGSVLVYLASFTIPYHEAILWGIAWTIATLSYALRFVLRPRRSQAVAMGVTAGLALLSRVTLGFGALAAVAALFAVSTFVRATDSRLLARRPKARSRVQALVTTIFGIPNAEAYRPFLRVLGLATLLPLLSYAAVNFAKFGSLFRVPLERHLSYALNRPRYDAVIASGGWFNPRYLVGNVVQYFRPDSLATSDFFPWVVFRFPPDPVANPLNVHYDGIEPHAGVTTTMPALLLLALIGVVAVLRARAPSDQPRVASVRLLVVAALACPLAAWSWPGLSQRYLGEFMPFLALAAPIGLFVLANRSRDSRAWKVGLAGLIGILGVFGVLVNLGTSIDYQHTSVGQTSASTRLAYLRFQENLAGVFDTGNLSTVDRRPFRRAPRDPRRGDLWLPKDCSTLLRFDGSDWLPIGPGESAELRLRVRFPEFKVRPSEPIVASGAKGAGEVIAVQYLTENSVRFAYVSSDAPLVFTASVVYQPDEPQLIDVDLGFMSGRVRLVANGVTLLDRAVPPGPRTGPVLLGRNDVLPRDVLQRTFSGTIQPVTTTAPACGVSLPGPPG